MFPTVYLANNPCYRKISGYDEHDGRNAPTTHAAKQIDFMFKGQPIIEHLTKRIWFCMNSCEAKRALLTQIAAGETVPSLIESKNQQEQVTNLESTVRRAD